MYPGYKYPAQTKDIEEKKAMPKNDSRRNLKVNYVLLTKLKKFCVERNMTMTAFVTKTLNEAIDNYSKQSE